MKQCIAHENEKVELYPGEKIKVETKTLNGVGRYVIDSDKDICYVFEQFTKCYPLPLINTKPHSQPSQQPTQPNSF